MIHGFVYLDRIKSQADFEEIIPLAAQDKHGVFAPTFIVRRQGNRTPIGWFSLASDEVPIILAWLSTKEVKARDSFTLFNQIENLVTLKGSTAVCFPIPEHSPFHPVMASMGYVDNGNYTFFVKKLT